MFFRLFILFTTIPLIELYLLLQLGRIIGVTYTILLVICTGLAGAWLAQSQGLSIFQHIRHELQQGRMPSDSLLEGLLLLIGGVVLLTPGLLTDIAGLVLLLPPSRTLVRKQVSKFFQNRIYIRPNSFGPTA